MQKLTSTENRCGGTAQLQMEHLYHTSAVPRLRDHCERGGMTELPQAADMVAYTRSLAGLEFPNRMGWLARGSPREPLVSAFLWNDKKVIQYLTFYIGSGDLS